MPGTADSATADVGVALGGPLGVWVETGVLTVELQALAVTVTNPMMINRAGLLQLTASITAFARTRFLPQMSGTQWANRAGCAL